MRAGAGGIRPADGGCRRNRRIGAAGAGGRPLERGARLVLPAGEHPAEAVGASAGPWHGASSRAVSRPGRGACCLLRRAGRRRTAARLPGRHRRRSCAASASADLRDCRAAAWELREVRASAALRVLPDGARPAGARPLGPDRIGRFVAWTAPTTGPGVGAGLHPHRLHCAGQTHYCLECAGRQPDRSHLSVSTGRWRSCSASSTTASRWR